MRPSPASIQPSAQRAMAERTGATVTKAPAATRSTYPGPPR
jgi:hypothetical protein